MFFDHNIGMKLVYQELLFALPAVANQERPSEMFCQRLIFRILLGPSGIRIPSGGTHIGIVEYQKAVLPCPNPKKRLEPGLGNRLNSVGQGWGKHLASFLGFQGDQKLGRIRQVLFGQADEKPVSYG